MAEADHQVPAEGFLRVPPEEACPIARGCVVVGFFGRRISSTADKITTSTNHDSDDQIG